MVRRVMLESVVVYGLERCVRVNGQLYPHSFRVVDDHAVAISARVGWEILS